MKKLMFASFIGSVLFASDAMPYFSYVNYTKNTNKEYAAVTGVYFSSYKSPYKTELDAEYTYLDYKDSPAYKQKDLTVIVNYFNEDKYRYRIGVHNIFASNPETVTKYSPSPMKTTSTTTTVYKDSYDYVLFIGAMYYQYLKYNVAADVYFSDYDSLNVYQVSPKAGYSFGDYNSAAGSFYAEIKLNYIKLSNSEAAPKDSYVNTDFVLKNFNGSWTNTLKASVGKTSYKVDNDGFVVYNLGEEYKNMYSFSVGKKLHNNDYVEVKFGYADFEETEGYEASSASVLISYSHTF